MISEQAMQRMKAKVQQRVGATPPATWAKVGVGVLVGGVAIGWIAFPYVLDKVVASQINLAEGRDSRRLWVQLPTLDCNIYVFNVTNPGAVMRGAKPEVQEVGPYCYKEVKDKTNFVEDPTTDTISYSARSTWYENQRSPDCPGSFLTGDEVVTVPNVPILSILLLAEKDFPAPFLTLVNQALPAIFGRVEDLFMRVTVRRLLFDGVLVNCTATALAPRAVCIALKQNSRALVKISENVYTFSFFGAKNHTPEEFRYTVKRGTADGQEIGRLVALDGRPELPFWRGDCNKLQGTDASVFPPFRRMENGSLVAYSSEACRVIFGIYEGQASYKGVDGYVYTALPFTDPEANPGDRCYCPADDRCRRKGVLDALKCQGAPILASHPHFYEGSPQYVDGVVGLKPDKEKHGIRIILEPISGTPLVARKRLQFNIEMKPIRFVPLTQRLRRVLVPLFWAEEMLDLDGDLMGLLEASLFRPIRAVDVIKWMCVVGGAGLGVLGVVLKVRKHRRDKVHVMGEEGGKEFDYETYPKSDKKPVATDVNIDVLEPNSGKKPVAPDVNIDVLDPFYVKGEENEISNGKILNGLPTVSKKSASTMTTANMSRPVSLDVNKLSRLFSNTGEDGNTRNIVRGSYQGNDSTKLINYDITTTEENHEYDFEKGHNAKEGNGGLETINPPSKENLESSQSGVGFRSPQKVTSLEHQMSFNSSASWNRPLNSTYTKPSHEVPSTNPNIDYDRANSGNVSGKSRHPAIPSGSIRNSADLTRDNNTGFQAVQIGPPVNLSHAFVDSIKAEVFESADGSTDKNNAEYKAIGDDISSHDGIGNKDTSQFVLQPETSNQTHTINEESNRSSAITHQETAEPTEEEIKAVEADINKLMSEMAVLLKQNKATRDD